MATGALIQTSAVLRLATCQKRRQPALPPNKRIFAQKEQLNSHSAVKTATEKIVTSKTVGSRVEERDMRYSKYVKEDFFWGGSLFEGNTPPLALPRHGPGTPTCTHANILIYGDSQDICVFF